MTEVCWASPISLKGWSDLKSDPSSQEESSSNLSTSWQEKENTWTPRGLWRSSFFLPWYNIVSHGWLLLQPFIWQGIKEEACVSGTHSQWRAESLNTQAEQRKRWGFSSDPDKYSWDTMKASQYCPAGTHNPARLWTQACAGLTKERTASGEKHSDFSTIASLKWPVWPHTGNSYFIHTESYHIYCMCWNSYNCTFI